MFYGNNIIRLLTLGGIQCQKKKVLIFSWAVFHEKHEEKEKQVLRRGVSNVNVFVLEGFEKVFAPEV